MKTRFIDVLAPGTWRPCRANLAFILWGLAFGVAARSALWFLMQHDLAAPLRVVLVLAPLVPAALCIAAGVRWLDGLDELQRRIQLNALAFVFPGLLVIALSVELVRAAGWLTGFAWSFRSLGFAMLASLSIGYLWSLQRYR